MTTTQQTHNARFIPAIGSAAVGLGAAIALALLAPAWLAYVIVGVVTLWLVAVGVDRFRKRGTTS